MNEISTKPGFYPADILLPDDVDMSKWAVVACDQFSAQPEYWKAVEENVGDAPSSLHLILPEAKLNSPDVDREITAIDETMNDYLHEGVFRELPDSLIYLERTQSDGRVRHGLVGMIDLEQYDFTPGSGSLIRATEGTVLSRIPPRVRVREGAPLELPHVILLIDDPDRTVIEPLSDSTDAQQVYDFDLQQGGGHLTGWRLNDDQMNTVTDGLAALCTPEAMEQKYGLEDASPMLFAVGDGNHSLATAKRCYEEQKAVTPEDQWDTMPSRYALVEVMNSHDEALDFEPIHRVLFGVDPERFMAAFMAACPNAYEGRGEGHVIEMVWAGHDVFITVPDPEKQLAVGTLQQIIDAYLRDHPGRVDYIHGEDVARKLGSQPDSMGFLLPAIGKEQLFKTVMTDGVLPRKTFSMGNAQDKRYYVEARRIH